MDISFRKILADSVKARYTTKNQIGPIKVADGAFVATLTDSTSGRGYDATTHTPQYPHTYSEICAEFTGATQLPPDAVLKRLLSVEEFNKCISLMHKLADDPKDVIVIGYGGMMINMIYIWNYMSRYIQRPIFKNVTIFENDNLSFSNLWRLLKSPTKFRLPYGAESINKTILLDDRYFASTVNAYVNRFTAGDIVDDTIYIGAPDFETRDILVSHKFLSILHSDNDISIISKPVVDSSITSETYGLIDINILFPNIYMASVKLLEIIDRNQYPTDEVLWTYNSAGLPASTQTCEVPQ